MRYLSVKNFDHFQHYKDRRPPWIKLYQDVLEDYAFTRLRDASKAHLMAIWLLASRSDNRIPEDAEWIGRSIHATEPVDLAALVSAGFLTVCDGASEVLAPCTQVARPEREKEGEAERESSSSSAADESELADDAPTDVVRLLRVLPSGASRTAWEAELAAAKQGMHSPPLTDEQIARACRDYLGNGHTTSPSLRHFRAFLVSAAKSSPAAQPTGRATPNDAGAHFARIRALIQQAPRVPGQPGRRFIRRTDVEALGERALQAYDEIGGADRFLDPEEKVGFLLRDFTKAYGTPTGATP